MTHQDLVLYLYSDFQLMHSVWKAMSRTHGVGAFVFFPEDYQNAAALGDVKYRFWIAKDVGAFLESWPEEEQIDFAENLDFMRYMKVDGYIALVVADTHPPDEQDVEVHRVMRTAIN